MPGIEAFEDLTVQVGTARVTLTYLGEGRSGDYDADDPEDYPHLRLDCTDAKAHPIGECQGEAGHRCRSTQDASTCTTLSTSADRERLRAWLTAIAQELDSAPHWKRLIEAHSWTSDSTVEKYAGSANASSPITET